MITDGRLGIFGVSRPEGRRSSIAEEQDCFWTPIAIQGGPAVGSTAAAPGGRAIARVSWVFAAHQLGAVHRHPGRAARRRGAVSGQFHNDTCVATLQPTRCCRLISRPPWRAIA